MDLNIKSQKRPMVRESEKAREALSAKITEEWLDALERNLLHLARPIEIGEWRAVAEHLVRVLRSCSEEFDSCYFHPFADEIDPDRKGSCETLHWLTVVLRGKVEQIRAGKKGQLEINFN